MVKCIKAMEHDGNTLHYHSSIDSMILDGNFLKFTEFGSNDIVVLPLSSFVWMRVSEWSAEDGDTTARQPS